MENNLFIKVDIHSLRGGIIGKIGADNFVILMAIGTFADENGRAYPSQDLIAEMVGCSRSTIIRKVKAIAALEFEGEPVIRIEKQKGQGGNKNVYYINPKVGITFGNKQAKKAVFINGDVETNVSVNVAPLELAKVAPLELLKVARLEQEQEPINKNHKQEPIKDKEKEIKDLKDYRFANAKEVITCFAAMYETKYGIPYQINWGRDTKNVKSKIVDVYSEEQIRHIVGVVFSDEFEKRWSKPQYPRPTLGQLTTWLAGEALNIVIVKEEKQAAIEQQQQRAEMTDEQFEKLMNLL